MSACGRLSHITLYQVADSASHNSTRQCDKTNQCAFAAHPYVRMNMTRIISVTYHTFKILHRSKCAVTVVYSVVATLTQVNGLNFKNHL